MGSTLLLLDVKNLWENSYIQFGSKVRLDFSKIIKKAKINNNIINAYAFISAITGKKQDSLIRKIQQANIKPVIYEGELDMDVVFNNELESCNIFILGSGSLDAIKYVTKANYDNKHTYIMACAEGLDKTLANEADDIILLEKSETLTL